MTNGMSLDLYNYLLIQRQFSKTFLKIQISCCRLLHPVCSFHSATERLQKAALAEKCLVRYGKPNWQRGTPKDFSLAPNLTNLER